jgi:hypothetical protein
MPVQEEADDETPERLRTRPAAGEERRASSTDLVGQRRTSKNMPPATENGHHSRLDVAEHGQRDQHDWPVGWQWQLTAAGRSPVDSHGRDSRPRQASTPDPLSSVAAARYRRRPVALTDDARRRRGFFLTATAKRSPLTGSRRGTHSKRSMCTLASVRTSPTVALGPSLAAASRQALPGPTPCWNRRLPQAPSPGRPRSRVWS